MKNKAVFSPAAHLLERAAGFITAVTGRFLALGEILSPAEREGLPLPLLEAASPESSPARQQAGGETQNRTVQLFTEAAGPVGAHAGGTPLPLQARPLWGVTGEKTERYTENTKERLHSVTERVQALQNTVERQSRVGLQTEHIGNGKLPQQAAGVVSAGQGPARYKQALQGTNSTHRLVQGLLPIQQKSSLFGGPEGQGGGKAAKVFLGGAAAMRQGEEPSPFKSSAAETPGLVPVPQVAPCVQVGQGVSPVYQKISETAGWGNGPLYGGGVSTKAAEAVAASKISHRQNTFSAVNGRSAVENVTVFSEQTGAAERSPLQGALASESAYEETRENMQSLRAVTAQPERDTAAATEIKIDMSGMTNRIHSDTDIDSFLDVLTDKLEKALVSTAEGIHV